jgi:hypothetical protein
MDDIEIDAGSEQNDTFAVCFQYDFFFAILNKAQQ